MAESIKLRGMTWDHSRGFTPMVATAQRFHELHPEIDISWSKRSLQEFADRPLGELAEQFDFLVIDHPWTGFAAVKQILAGHLKTKPTDDWLAVLEPADIWCAKLHDWSGLRTTEAYQVHQSDGCAYRTTRCPIRIDGERIYNPKGSPVLGEHTKNILNELE
ncbi:CoA transferase [Pontiella sulfatireligans]|uniref:Extracellular solute-binding protein n=1 Tax=Pontiella sulfatireligans TaxID=2750658 RepID=A0A6C2URY0_9BACT|nr:CoA transferase [Pontiella sulfatireligans]VGO22014.1 hypothetical protein SCARR_04095 [Pontiella sulfatireligans]